MSIRKSAYATARGTELQTRRGNRSRSCEPAAICAIPQGITRASRRASTAPFGPALAYPLHPNSNT
jgi:hypothetical protein